MSTRDALIEATKSLLSTKGYQATSPRDIQRTSGVGQGSFYHHFDGKAELASAALSSLAREMCASFDGLSDGTDAELIRAYLEQPRDAGAGCRIGRLTMEASLSDERIREPVEAYFAHVRRRLTAAFDTLDLDVPAAALADLAIAAVQGGYVVARATGDPTAMQHTTSALLALVDAAASTTGDHR